MIRDQKPMGDRNGVHRYICRCAECAAEIEWYDHGESCLMMEIPDNAHAAIVALTAAASEALPAEDGVDLFGAVAGPFARQTADVTSALHDRNDLAHAAQVLQGHVWHTAGLLARVLRAMKAEVTAIPDAPPVDAPDPASTRVFGHNCPCTGFIVRESETLWKCTRCGAEFDVLAKLYCCRAGSSADVEIGQLVSPRRMAVDSIEP